MKKILYILAIVVVSGSISGSYAYAQNAVKFLDGIDEIFKKVEEQPYKEAVSNIRQILEDESITDIKLQSLIAKEGFGYLKNSPLMGSSSLAIYIAETYFLNGKLPLPENELFEMRYYYLTNKNTLLGLRAPEIRLKDTLGRPDSLSELLGEYTIIYFYSDSCSYCKKETPLLIDFLDNYTSTPINLYAVYIGSDSLRWKNYIRQNFNIQNPFVYRLDGADLKGNYNFALEYGITSTPSLFLLNQAHQIIGRKVKTAGIKEILENEHFRHAKFYDYFTAIFPDSLGEEALIEGEKIIDTLFQKSSKDIDFFRDLFRELYYYLSSSQDVVNQELAAYLGQTYIIETSSLWGDTIFVDRIKKAVNNFNKNRVGSHAKEVELYDFSGLPASLLSGEGKYKILFFYKPGCRICNDYALQLIDLQKLTSKKVSFTGVYTLKDRAAWQKFIIDNKLTFRNLWDKGDTLAEVYDIENTPAIYLLEPDNRVIAKDLNPQELKELLKKLKLIKN